jgi:isoamylase
MKTPGGSPGLWPGSHRELGATYDGSGTNFAVWAPAVTSVTLCLFDDDGRERQLVLTERTLGVWHGYVPGASPGLRYGFRVDGHWDSAAGRVFDPDKLLLDPYARAIDQVLVPHASLAGRRHGTARNPGDTAPYVPRSVVVADEFDWGDDRRPDLPWGRTVIYEAHVRGLTRVHPDVAEEQRGTYSALGHPSVTGYLRDLGVTSVELLPVQQFVSEPGLTAQGRVNYWGYNTVGFFAPHAGYASTGSRGE